MKHKHLTLLWIIVALLVAGVVTADAQKKSAGRKRNPPAKVMQALQAKFPDATIEKWTRETEGGVALYDIEFRQHRKKLEADIKEDGTIDNWERQIPLKELPPPVRDAVRKGSPGSTMTEAMETFLVKEGKDEDRGFEITLRTKDGKRAEVTVAPDGRILEGPGAGK